MRVLAPSAVCGCVDCRNPVPANRDLRLVHGNRHHEFSERYKSRPTDRELGCWAAMKRLRALTDTEPVLPGQCERPDHAMLPAHPSHIR